MKRVEEQDDGERLVGVEFLSPEAVHDPALAKALANMGENPRGFEEGISRLISRYVFQCQVESETGT